MMVQEPLAYIHAERGTLVLKGAAPTLLCVAEP
jgi:hypothetical protein